MIYEAMLQVRDGGKKLFKGKLPPPPQWELNKKVCEVLDKVLEGSGIDVKGFRLKVEAYAPGHVPYAGFEPPKEAPQARVEARDEKLESFAAQLKAVRAYLEPVVKKGEEIRDASPDGATRVVWNSKVSGLVHALGIVEHLMKEMA